MKYTILSALLVTSSEAAPSFLNLVNLFVAPKVEENRDSHERTQASISLSGLKENKGELSLGADTDLTVTAVENRTTGFQW